MKPFFAFSIVVGPALVEAAQGFGVAGHAFLIILTVNVFEAAAALVLAAAVNPMGVAAGESRAASGQGAEVRIAAAFSGAYWYAALEYRTCKRADRSLIAELAVGLACV